MSSIIYLSQNGYDNLKKELHILKSVDRPHIINQLSENAEYDAAKEAQGLLEARISKLENDLSNSRVIDESQLSTDSVSLLSKVTIKNPKNNMEMTYAVVSESEANLAEKKISASSPIGKGLLGKKVGEVVEIQIPNGIVNFEIIDISRL